MFRLQGMITRMGARGLAAGTYQVRAAFGGALGIDPIDAAHALVYDGR